MLLRTESQAQANQLLAQLRVSAHHYAAVAERVGGALGEQLAAVARERGSLATRLNEAIRHSGDLPDALDPERVGLGDLALRARQWLQGPDQVVKDTLEQEDTALLERAGIAAEGTAEVREVALALRAQVAATRARLSAR